MNQTFIESFIEREIIIAVIAPNFESLLGRKLNVIYVISKNPNKDHYSIEKAFDAIIKPRLKGQ